MIHYSLRCDRGHEFDGWFGSSSAFNDQLERGLVSCPICGTDHVSRALMAPAVRSTKGDRPAAAEQRVDAAPPAADPTHASLSDKDHDKVAEAMRALRAAVTEQGVDVGRRFAEEARRIHYGEAEPRGIYGQANTKEAKELLEEGIKILPLPPLPEDRN